MELTANVIAAAQTQNSAIQSIFTVIRNGGQRPAWNEIQSSSEDTRILWAQFDSLLVQNDVLCRQYFRADDSVE
jgi:hypothetical protein